MKHKIWDFPQICYSQEGEDLILQRYFQTKKTGCFVDVGAHHPIRFSNTYKFYRSGWRGINIDAMPGSMKQFQKVRPHDINIEAAISDKEEELKFYIFCDTALNTFSETNAKVYSKTQGIELLNTQNIKTKTLKEILGKFFKQNQEIDFMSIDVEGYDEKVLRSNDWGSFRPKVILIELLNLKIEDIQSNSTYRFLDSLGYRFFAKTINTFFFELKN